MDEFILLLVGKANRSNNGFCRKRVLGITENGLCDHIYNKNGQIKSNWQEKINEEFM